MALSGNSRKLPFEVIRVSLFIQIDHLELVKSITIIGHLLLDTLRGLFLHFGVFFVVYFEKEKEKYRNT